MPKPLSRPLSHQAAVTSDGRRSNLQGERSAIRAAVCADAAAGGSHANAQAGGTPYSEADVHVKVGALSYRIDALSTELGDCFRELGILRKGLAECRPKSVMDVPPNEQPATPAMRKSHDLLTANDIAGLVRCDAKTVRRWRREGKLPPALTFGGLVRWRASDIDAWIEEQEESNS